MLAWVTGRGEGQRRLKVESLAAENRIRRDQTLSFIRVGSRKVYVAGMTANPTDAWVRQAARNLTFNSCGLLAGCRYLLRDRDTQFTAGLDMILRSVGIEPLPLPPRSPNLNAFVLSGSSGRSKRSASTG